MKNVNIMLDIFIINNHVYFMKNVNIMLDIFINYIKYISLFLG